MVGEKQTFRAVIEKADNGSAFVRIPFDVEEVFGKKRVGVKATIDGSSYRGSLVRMGGPCHLLVVPMEIRDQIGKSFGDEIEVTVEKDTEPREIIIPHDLRDALAGDPEAKASFDQLPYSHRKEYVQWIEEARRDQTRRRRIGQALELLKRGGRRQQG